MAMVSGYNLLKTRTHGVHEVAYTLPRAGDKCWYHALAAAPLSAVTRTEVGARVAGLSALIEGLRAEAPGRSVVLADFGQGACVVLEHGFAGGAQSDAIFVLTGCRVGQARDERPSRLPDGLQTYLSAGDRDSWIPLSAFAKAAIGLGLGGAALRMDVFPGRPYEASGPELAMLDEEMADLAAGRAPGQEVGR